MGTQLGISLCAATIISYLKYKRKAIVKELLYAYDCIKNFEKINDKLPIIVEKTSLEYETFLNKKDIWDRLYIYALFSANCRRY